MATIRRIRTIPPEELVKDIRSALELDEDDEVTTDLDDNAETADGIPVRVRQKVRLEDGDVAELDEYYEVSDFDIEVYDWAGDTLTPTLRWRMRMLDRFGTDYATSYLLKGRDPKGLR